MIWDSQMFWWKSRTLHSCEDFIFALDSFFSFFIDAAVTVVVNYMNNWSRSSCYLKSCYAYCFSELCWSLLYYSIAPMLFCVCGFYALKVFFCFWPFALPLFPLPCKNMLFLLQYIPWFNWKAESFLINSNTFKKSLPSPGNCAVRTSGFT